MYVMLCLMYKLRINFSQLSLSTPRMFVTPVPLAKLIAFEFSGEDRDRRENPVLSRLKIAFFALHKRDRTGFPLRLENFAANSNAISCMYCASSSGGAFGNAYYWHTYYY
jgi:hypothetical protein